MKRKHVVAAAAITALFLTAGAVMAAESGQSAGQDIKDAGHSVASGTKKAAHKVKHGVKKGVHKSAAAVEKGADKVESKTSTP